MEEPDGLFGNSSIIHVNVMYGFLSGFTVVLDRYFKPMAKKMKMFNL